MTDRSIALRAAAGELAYVEERLERNDLPAAAVRDHPEWFVVAVSGGERVGVGGLQPADGDALLRSVVVEERARGEGYGSALCDALEDRARAAGFDALYLLTTTASEFFADRGYEAVSRDAAPAAVRETAQFRDRCPATATCMRRVL